MPITRTAVAAALQQANVLKHGLFTLRSGAKSPVYVDLRHVPSVPGAMDALTDAMAERVVALGAEVVAGAETAGIPLAAVIAHKTRLPMVYVRKEPKAYGTGSQIEGLLTAGRKVVLIDDLITQGTSKFVFMDALDAAGADATDILVILDREQGGREALQARGKRLHSLVTLRELLEEYGRLRVLDADQINDIHAYLDDPGAWEAALRV